MMSLQIQKIRAWGCHIGFDGDILSCKPSGIVWRHPQVELPINVLLDYRYRLRPMMARLDLFINSYSFGQQKPKLLRVSPLYIIRPKTQRIAELLAAFDQVILANLAGNNLGLHHIEAEHMRAFYEERKSRALINSMASMKIVYNKDMEGPADGNVLSLPERHELAS